MAANRLLIARIEKEMQGRNKMRFAKPFDIRAYEDGNDMVKAIALVREVYNEIDVLTNDNYVIPINELTNRELMKVRQALNNRKC